MAQVRRIAVLGTGVMGAAMARNLARAGYQVAAWNRSPEALRPLRSNGVETFESVTDAVDGAALTITMLADGAAVKEVMIDGGGLSALGARGRWAQMSTVGVRWTESLSTVARDQRVEFIDAPVLGTRQPAEAGKLVVIASGSAEAHDACMPVFDVIARKVIWLGAAPGDATRLKLVMNSWLMSLVELLAETLAYAESLGGHSNAFLEALEGGAFDVPYAQTRGSAMIDPSETFTEVSFALDLAVKDAALVLDSAEDSGIDLPIMRVVRQRFALAVAEGFGRKDMAATALVAKRARMSPGSPDGS